MLCEKCLETKLSEEFAPETLTADCDHAALLCLRCAVRGAKLLNSCAYPGCRQSITSIHVVEKLERKLDRLFPRVDQPEDLPLPPVSHSSSGRVNAILMTGQTYVVKYSSNPTIREVKESLEAKIDVPPEKQRLTFGETELKDFLPSGSPAKLSSYNVPPNGNINLLIVLYSVPKHFNHVVLDLFWGYPNGHRDFLDASCLVFAQGEFLNKVDYAIKRSIQFNNAIFHSGDHMDDRNQQGHHMMSVKLHDLPEHISHLFFTLSAYNQPTIAHFPNPSLRFYEASNPNHNLCETTVSHAGDSSAVIMCYLVRNRSGTWDIVRSGKLSDGRAKKGFYRCMIHTIQKIIKGVY